MEDSIQLSKLIKDLMEYGGRTEPAVADLHMALNEVIDKYKLHPSVVISLLARFSAAYIHSVQRWYDNRDADVVVEEDFQNFLTANLLCIDMEYTNRDIEKSKNENLN